MNYQVLILAAGQGTRMGSANVPKVLVPLHGRPLISYVLDTVAKLEGPPRPIIVIGFQGELVEQTLGVQYEYIWQKQQLGTAHAVAVSLDRVTAENLLVLYGDVPLIQAASLRQLLDRHLRGDAAVSLLTTTVPHFEGLYQTFYHHFGRIIRDVEGKIIGITEAIDAGPEEKNFKEVNPGIYLFQTAWLKTALPQLETNNSQQELYLTDLVALAIKQGQKVTDLEVSPEEVFGVNNRGDLRAISELISSQNP